MSRLIQDTCKRKILFPLGRNELMHALRKAHCMGKWNFFYDSEWMREGWMLEWILRTQFRAYFIGLQGRLQGTPSIFTSPEVLQ